MYFLNSEYNCQMDRIIPLELYKYYILAIILSFHKVSLFFKEHNIYSAKDEFHFKKSIPVKNLNLLIPWIPETHI